MSRQAVWVRIVTTEEITTEGKFGEVLIFSEARSDETIERVENYLLTRWKIERKSKITFGAPLAYLSFEDRNGNRIPNAADPSKSANTNDNNKEVMGKFGKGIQFSGDDAMNFPSGFGDFDRHQTFSMAFWIQPTSKLDRAVIVRRSKAWTDAASRGMEVLIENGRLSPALIHFWPAMRYESNQNGNSQSINGHMLL